MIARTETRDGCPVKLGNDPSIMPGAEDTYQSYGVAWANLSNTPFRLYKHWVHEGGIATPLIAHWPKGIVEKGALRHIPGQLPDLMATVLKVSGASYPEKFKGDIFPLEGVSLAKSFGTDHERIAPLFWEHGGNAAVRVGRWRLVREYPKAWELYDMGSDRTEMHDVAAEHPSAKRCGVIPREKVLGQMAKLAGNAFWEKDEE